MLGIPNRWAVCILDGEASERDHKLNYRQHVGDGLVATGNADQPPIEFHRTNSVQVEKVRVVRRETKLIPGLWVVKDGIHELLEGLVE